MSNRLAGAMIVCWTIVYGWVAAATHLSLRTNAYDLSLFDYAVWNTLHGRAGYVPFIGHSIFSEHFMPALYLLAPVYAIAQAPATLIAVQLALAAAAAWTLHRLTIAASLGGLSAFAVVFAFLFSRRSHEAIMSFFYPESAQPLLIFVLVLAWLAERRVLYWTTVVVLLATKEDAAVYVGAFAALQAISPRRRGQALATLLVAVVWLGVAVGVMIPRSRAADGLPGASHFLAARYGDSGGVALTSLVSRVARFDTIARIFNLLAPFALVSLAAPAWLATAVPGLLIDRAASPEAMQSALTGHYAFPLLPWVAIAAVFGLKRIARARPMLAVTWAAAIVLLTVADTPLLRPSTLWRIDPDASRVRAQLPATIDAGCAAQPNLIPHLPHDNSMTALWPDAALPDSARTILLTPVGDLWPFADAEQIRATANRYGADPRLSARLRGPLYWFEVREVR